MKNYLIVTTTKDALGIEQLSVMKEFDTRAEAVKGCKDLECGTYSLLSVLRADFTIRDSFRVVQKVVEWGTTTHPRTRKAKSNGVAKAKKGKGLKAAIEEIKAQAQVEVAH